MLGKQKRVRVRRWNDDRYWSQCSGIIGQIFQQAFVAVRCVVKVRRMTISGELNGIVLSEVDRMDCNSGSSEAANRLEASDRPGKHYSNRLIHGYRASFKMLSVASLKVTSSGLRTNIEAKAIPASKVVFFRVYSVYLLSATIVHNPPNIDVQCTQRLTVKARAAIPSRRLLTVLREPSHPVQQFDHWDRCYRRGA